MFWPRVGSWREEARFVWPSAIKIVDDQRNLLLALAVGLAVGGFFWGKATGRSEHAEVIEKWSRSELADWGKRFEGDTEENLVQRFDACRRLCVDDAIPFAYLYARLPSEADNRTQWHVIAARRFLRIFDDDMIIDRLNESMANRPDTAPAILRRTLELIR